MYSTPIKSVWLMWKIGMMLYSIGTLSLRQGLYKCKVRTTTFLFFHPHLLQKTRLIRWEQQTKVRTSTTHRWRMARWVAKYMTVCCLLSARDGGVCWR